MQVEGLEFPTGNSTWSVVEEKVDVQHCGLEEEEEDTRYITCAHARARRPSKQKKNKPTIKQWSTAAPMDSCVVPHRSTNRAVLWLTAQIRRDAVLSESYGRRHLFPSKSGYMLHTVEHPGVISTCP